MNKETLLELYNIYIDSIEEIRTIEIMILERRNKTDNSQEYKKLTIELQKLEVTRNKFQVLKGRTKERLENGFK